MIGATTPAPCEAPVTIPPTAAENLERALLRSVPRLPQVTLPHPAVVSTLLGIARSGYPASGYEVLDADDLPVFWSADFERAVSHAESLFDGEVVAGAEYVVVRDEWDEGWTRVVCGSVREIGGAS